MNLAAEPMLSGKASDLIEGREPRSYQRVIDRDCSFFWMKSFVD
jgi:hypothetical protein